MWMQENRPGARGRATLLLLLHDAIVSLKSVLWDRCAGAASTSLQGDTERERQLVLRYMKTGEGGGSECHGGCAETSAVNRKVPAW